jgi:hypothetical protein
MIIALSNEKINIGDIVINIKDINEKYYIITAGQEFYVVDYDKKYDLYIIKSEDLIIRLSKSFLTKKINLKNAKNEYIERCDRHEYNSYIFSKCPNKAYGYGDREQYDACKILEQKGYYGAYCRPSLKCAKYLTKEDRNNNKLLLKYLRIKKIKKINEN